MEVVIPENVCKRCHASELYQTFPYCHACCLFAVSDFKSVGGACLPDEVTQEFILPENVEDIHCGGVERCWYVENPDLLSEFVCMHNVVASWDLDGREILNAFTCQSAPCVAQLCDVCFVKTDPGVCELCHRATADIGIKVPHGGDEFCYFCIASAIEFVFHTSEAKQCIDRRAAISAQKAAIREQQLQERREVLEAKLHERREALVQQFNDRVVQQFNYLVRSTSRMEVLDHISTCVTAAQMMNLT